jgi:hypothetical protein
MSIPDIQVIFNIAEDIIDDITPQHRGMEPHRHQGKPIFADAQLPSPHK